MPDTDNELFTTAQEARIRQIVKETKAPEKLSYTVREAAKALSQSEYTIREWIKADKIKASRTTRSYRIAASEINRLLKPL